MRNTRLTQTSHIEMHEVAANAFPIMLDYLYCLWDSNDKPIAAENAVPLHYLGSYFEIRGLRKQTRIFWKKDMAASETGTYLEHGKLFHDDKVYQAVVEKCSSSIRSIKVDSHLMEVSDAKFWLDLLEENNGEPNPALSTLISSFCFKNKEVLDTETFLKLTNISVLPELSVAAAMELLELDKLFPATPTSPGELSDLQERGLEALISYRDDDPILFLQLQCHLKKFSPLVLLQLFERSLTKLWHCNRRLEVTAGCLPKAISGAGVDAVNGTYYLTNELREIAPRFAMDGRWRGSPAKFDLHLRRSLYQKVVVPQWNISILDGTIPCCKDKIFYFANASTDRSRLPPKIGWAPCSWLWNQVSAVQGDTAAFPILSFRFHEIPLDKEAWYLRN